MSISLVNILNLTNERKLLNPSRPVFTTCSSSTTTEFEMECIVVHYLR